MSRIEARLLLPWALTAFVASVGLSIAGYAFAYETADAPARPRSLLDLEIHHKSVEAGGQVRFTRVAKTNALLSGGVAEIIFNQVFGVGVSHFSLATDVQPDTVSEPLEVSQTGILLDLIGDGERAQHVRFGFGIAALRVEGVDLNGEPVKGQGTVLEPDFGFESNLFPFVRVGFGLGYRAAILPSAAPVSSRKLTGAYGLVSLYAGWF